MINPYALTDDGLYCKVFFNDGTHFLIDADDLENISEMSWFKGKRGYPAAHTSRKSPEGHKGITLHRFLMKPPNGYDVDHISGDKLDNRRANLRICSHQQNMFNQKTRSTNTSGFKGVSYSRNAGKYEAYIHKDGKKRYLGLFDTAEDAAYARDKAASLLFGEYASLNEAL